MRLSVCIPVYFAEATIERLVGKLRDELSAAYDLEIVLVNDGSRDNSEEICTRLAETTQGLVFVSLRRNFGEHNAVMCALTHCTGEYAVIVDDDFQNPPEEIARMVEKAREGYDVVYSRYDVKMHATHRNLGSRFNDRMSTWLLNKPKDLYLSSFKVLSRGLIDEVIKYRGPFPYIDGLILRSTSSIGVVTVRHDAREDGKSNYTVQKLISLWLNMFINFSIKPLRTFTIFGAATSALSFVAILYFLYEKLVHPEINYGWTSLMTGITFFAGIQLIFLGLISEYLGKQYLTANGTPQWVIKCIHRHSS